jgi:hypothetical protein
MPVAPLTGADLAITAGESAWLHVPYGSVDIEIQSTCNAEVEMSIVTSVGLARGADDTDRPTVSTHESGGMLVGTDSPDGRASVYHLTPGLDPDTGMYHYTARCVGQPPIQGNLVVDRIDATDWIGASTNARVFSSTMSPDRGIHVFGTVLPGARVSIGAKQLVLGQADSSNDYAIYSTFATDVPVPLEHPVATVRVDDAKGTHFYVIHSSGLKLVESCAATMSAPKQAAAKLAAEGSPAAALRTLEAGMTTCKPDRDMHALALSYACKAGDVEAAKKYWRKLPPELQRTFETECANNGITREALDRP